MDNNRSFTDLVEMTYFDRENTKFYLTPAGFPALEAYMKKVVTNDLKEESEEVLWQDLGRVYFHRAFPFDMPHSYISVLDKDQKEIGMIRELSALAEDTQKIILSELGRKYYAPRIKKILSVKERYGFSYWRVDLENASDFSFTVQDTYRSMLKIDHEHVFIVDVDGNRFEIPSVEALDRASYKKIELYL